MGRRRVRLRPCDGSAVVDVSHLDAARIDVSRRVS